MPTPVHPYSEYGVALRTLQSARGWLGLLLFACVVAQFIGFSLMWFTPQPYESNRPQYAHTRFDAAREQFWRLVYGEAAASQMAKEPPSNEPFFPGTEQGRKLNIRKQWDMTYSASVPFSQMLGLMAVCSQVIIIFLTLLVILVAQAPGVSQVTRGLIWSVLLLFMVLPWQYLAPGFPFPGILYGYREMMGMIGPHMVAGEKVYPYQKLLVYGRFVLWPAVGMIVLLITSERFRAGIMLAIGHPLQSMMQPRTPMPPVGGRPAALAPERK